MKGTILFPAYNAGRVGTMHENREIVYTVTDYYDGPRGGIADFRGKPHVYSSVWDKAADDWSNTFFLQQVDDETFRLALEDWAIWCRWERAFHAGETTLATHPALPAERTRHDELTTILTPRLQIVLREPFGSQAGLKCVRHHSRASFRAASWLLFGHQMKVRPDKSRQPMAFAIRTLSSSRIALTEY